MARCRSSRAGGLVGRWRGCLPGRPPAWPSAPGWPHGCPGGRAAGCPQPSPCCPDGWLPGCPNGCPDGWLPGWPDGCPGGWSDIWPNSAAGCSAQPVSFCLSGGTAGAGWSAKNSLGRPGRVPSEPVPVSPAARGSLPPAGWSGVPGPGGGSISAGSVVPPVMRCSYGAFGPIPPLRKHRSGMAEPTVPACQDTRRPLRPAITPSLRPGLPGACARRKSSAGECSDVSSPGRPGIR